MSRYTNSGKRLSSQTHAKRTFHCLCGKTVHGNGGISAHRKACAVSGSTRLGHRNDAAGVTVVGSEAQSVSVPDGSSKAQP